MIRRSSRARSATARRRASRPIASSEVCRSQACGRGRPARAAHDVGLRRPPELRRQHADDLERPAVQRDGPADDRRIGAEARARHSRIAQQDDAVPADRFFLARKSRPSAGVTPIDVEELRRHCERRARARVRRRR